MNGTSSTGSASVDGRRRRGEDNRARIVAAVIALVRDGEFTPSAEQVAARADVSLRTVFRHFEDMDRLYGQIVGPIEAELMLVAQRPFTANHWRGKLDEIIERRAGAFEEIAPLRRAADLHRHKSPRLEEAATRFSTVLRGILDHTIPAEAADGATREAIDLLLSFEAWDRLRRVQGLSPEHARQALQVAVEKLLGDA